MMAMMMTGRVLLVCALCVLWCVAGGVYARDLDNNAQEGCMASGVLGMNASYVPNGCNKYMPMPPLRSALPIPAIQAEDEQLTDVSQDGTNSTSVNAPESGSGVGSGGSPGPAASPGSPTGAGGPAAAAAAAGPAGPAGPAAAAPAAPNVVPGAAAAGGGPNGPAGVTGGNAGSSGATDVLGAAVSSDVPSSLPADSENSNADCGEEASDCGNQEKLEKTKVENQELEASKTQKTPATQNTKSKDNEENSTEASSTELQNTETQQEIKPPVDENDTTSTDASTAVAAQSTSAGIQEEATESSSDGSHSPLQGEVFTGTDTPENAPSPAAAEAEKRQGENVTKDGDSDSTTAVSHTTSPLLLLVACAAAAVVVAA
ncbi:mucin-associated surface protein (MASP) [Trypanosoma cruzi]|uniref:Mucin-associated surface protein (MASP), putative n=2 Tax=Trypanosoma cruzi TaxID=5693 RepID=Q4DH35_TRYCC|nr:mucin-associated surface protein (MASP), putative [Trypanosoma cruzi]EAN91831.1 mucin-associated surface protein (MASP), putative [Trypanosoma cruzi]RNC54376.1 mucin-associated surface protein (MASP) [Trypanosoma cruzi]|eukprot:XP_813682.1 mucin-associated surface protein (MASP) [Trypanosoma cruzi strain CL Brener]